MSIYIRMQNTSTTKIALHRTGLRVYFSGPDLDAWAFSNVLTPRNPEKSRRALPLHVLPFVFPYMVTTAYDE